MPVHDWRRVPAGIFHDFHHEWISSIKKSLNSGLLPAGYYALAEQKTGHVPPDVLTLETGLPAPGDAENANGSELHPSGCLTLATTPPKVRYKASTKPWTTKHKRLAIRHVSNHRVVAMIEIVSPGNKSSAASITEFITKAAELLHGGIHLLLVDLFPPTARDPHGIHHLIWSNLDEPNDLIFMPGDDPLTLVSYSVGYELQAFVEGVSVGDSLPDMPLFLTAENYIPVPLETTYHTAWEAVPAIWRDQLK